MIVVVEGPSAAGKTTWCRDHAEVVVPEYTATGNEPDTTDVSAQAAHWTAVNGQRWASARAEEARSGTAVCDTDPLKLHYSWCLSRIGAAPRARFDDELARNRVAFAEGTLGLADVVLVTIPPLDVLRGRRDRDASRSRRSFELHARLAEPLRDWYRAVDALEPGRVWWEHPADGLPTPMPAPRPDRSDVRVLDRLVGLLPRL